MHGFWNHRDQDKRALPETPASRAAILEAGLHAAHGFLDAGDWREAIDEIFGRLGEAADASRVVLYVNEFDAEGSLWATRQGAWVSPRRAADGDHEDSRRFSYADAGLQRWAEVLAAGEDLVGDVTDFPAGEHAALASMDVVSVAVVPVFVAGAWWGWLGFDECRHARSWTQSIVSALHATAATLGAAVDRLETEASTYELREHFLCNWDE